MEENLQYIPQEGNIPIIEKITQIVTFESFFMFGVLYAGIIWITMVLWVAVDVKNRSSNFFMKFFSVVFTILLGPLGLLIYLIIRPNNLVNKKFLSEIEHNLVVLSHMVEKSKKGLLLCPKCSRQISHVSKVCPKCKENLEKKCTSCKKILLHGWKVCPFCAHKVSKKKHKKKK